jgi:hypothetical protein
MSSPDVESNNQQILNDIQSLQSIESDLFNKLESDTNISSSDQQSLIDKINNISNMRINLYKTLGDMTTFFQNSLQSSQGTLSTQTQTIGIVEEELKKARMNLQLLKEDKNNKLRLIEINQYYGDKYQQQGILMRILIMMLVPILILALLNRIGILPNGLYYLLITIIAIIGGIFFVRKFLSIMYRDNMNFQEIQFPFNPNAAPGPDGSGNDPWQTSGTGTCIGDACCTTGMTWDSSLNQCAISSTSTNTSTSTPTVVSESFVNNIFTRPAYNYRYKKPDVILGSENIQPSFSPGFVNYSAF